VSEGDVSDWGPSGNQQQQQQGGGGREEMRALKDSLRLMAAEVALSQGDTEEAGKLLRSLLMRYVVAAAAVVCLCKVGRQSCCGA
jgi:hypothetical protein